MTREATAEELKKILVDQGFIALKNFEDIVARASKTKERPIDVMIDHDLISLRQWGRLWAKHLGYPFVYLQEENIEPQVLQIVPELVARNKKVIAFDHGRDSIKVAMTDPGDLEMLNMLEKKSGVPVEVFYATAEDIETTIAHYRKDITKEFEELIRASKMIQPGSGYDATVITMVEKLFSYAHQNNASDIHIEPYEQKIVVRFRIDGILHFVLDLPKDLLEMIVTRIKVLARLKTDEHRSAQDGKIRHTIDTVRVDIRVSIIPIIEGEKVVMRLLSDRNRQFTLSHLGLDGAGLEKIQRNAKRSYGMILATGPTGSGKTTTLYSIVKILNSLKVNIATIEDPVEYDIEGINQIQVDPKTNLTFASGLKSILRQDPDIIMLGEVRDAETAHLAINAALTGHLLLSTLHTNDAATTIPRLEEMSITRYFMTAAINVIIAQRLVRNLCVKCRYSYDPSEEELAIISGHADLSVWAQHNLDAPKPFFKSKGCKVCGLKGYAGRSGIFEVLEMTEPMRKIILAGANADDVKRAAVEQGMRTMLEDGMGKVLAGVTTLDEVLRTISV